MFTHICEAPLKWRCILAITTHRMPNILTSVRHTKRHLNYLNCTHIVRKMLQILLMCLHCHISLPIRRSSRSSRAAFFPSRCRELYFCIEYLVSYWTKHELKLGCINSRLHWTPCCNLQFSKSLTMHWNFRENFTFSKESNQQWLKNVWV